MKAFVQAKRYRPAKCALGIALKHKPQNWQVCDNFSLAAAKSGEPIAAAHAVLSTLKLSCGQRVHAEVLELLVDAVDRGRSQSQDTQDTQRTEDDATPTSSANNHLSSIG